MILPSVSVNTNRNSTAIQPVREGRTLIQAKTLCGEPVGPPIEIEIRTCDQETQAELKRQQEELMRREREIVKRIAQLTGDKTAELIAATLTGEKEASDDRRQRTPGTRIVHAGQVHQAFMIPARECQSA